MLRHGVPAVVMAPPFWRCREEGLKTSRLRVEAIDVQTCLLVLPIQARPCQRICSNYKAVHVHAAFSGVVLVKPRLQQCPLAVVGLIFWATIFKTEEPTSSECLFVHQRGNLNARLRTTHRHRHNASRGRCTKFGSSIGGLSSRTVITGPERTRANATSRI